MRGQTLTLLIFLILLLLQTTLALEIDSEGYVTYVVDGDTIDVYATSGFGAGTKYRIRFADINAPELSTYEGQVAKQALRNLLDNEHVYIDVDDITTYDKYGRVVAVVYLPVNSTHVLNVNYYMVANGYAEIWDFTNNEFSPYTWKLYEQTFSPDSYEPDDTMSQASTITVGTSQQHNFHKPGDVDWIKFYASSGYTYTIETYNLGDSCDTVIYLYDSYGNLIDSNDDGGYELYASKIEFIPSQSGYYYVKVKHFNSSAYGEGTEYWISVDEKIVIKEISIGVLVDLSGPLTTYGTDIKNTLTIAEEDINKYLEEKGLPYHVKFYYEDTRVNPEVTLEKVQALYGRGINLIIGPMGSGEVANIKDFVTANKIVIISPSSTALPSIIGFTTPEEKKYIFRFVGTDDLQTDAIASELKDVGIKAVIITYIGNAWGRGLYETIKPKLENAGIEIKDAIEYPDSPPADFTPYIATMESDLNDLLKTYSTEEVAIVTFSYEEVFTLISQAKPDSVLFNVVWFGCDGIAKSGRVGEVCEKVIKIRMFSTLFESKGSSYDKLAKEYFKRGFGDHPYQFSLNAYDAAWVLVLSYIETVNKTGSYDPDVMAETIPVITEKYSKGEYGVYPVSGYITLNEWNDRASGDYAIWHVNENCEWDIAGVWKFETKTIEWYHKPLPPVIPTPTPTTPTPTPPVKEPEVEFTMKEFTFARGEDFKFRGTATVEKGTVVVIASKDLDRLLDKNKLAEKGITMKWNDEYNKWYITTQVGADGTWETRKVYVAPDAPKMSYTIDAIIAKDKEGKVWSDWKDSVTIRVVKAKLNASISRTSAPRGADIVISGTTTLDYVYIYADDYPVLENVGDIPSDTEKFNAKEWANKDKRYKPYIVKVEDNKFSVKLEVDAKADVDTYTIYVIAPANPPEVDPTEDAMAQFSLTVTEFGFSWLPTEVRMAKGDEVDVYVKVNCDPDDIYVTGEFHGHGARVDEDDFGEFSKHNETEDGGWLYATIYPFYNDTLDELVSEGDPDELLKPGMYTLTLHMYNRETGEEISEAETTIPVIVEEPELNVDVPSEVVKGEPIVVKIDTNRGEKGYDYLYVVLDLGVKKMKYARIALDENGDAEVEIPTAGISPGTYKLYVRDAMRTVKGDVEDWYDIYPADPHAKYYNAQDDTLYVRDVKIVEAVAVFEIGDYNIAVGGTATIPIEIKGITDLGSATIEIHYDPSVINVESVDAGNLGDLTWKIDNTAGIVRLVWYTTTGKTGNFTFARLNVKAVNEGTTELGIVVETCADSSGNPIPVSVNNGTVTVKYATIGDANGDGRVTVVDAMFIAQYVAGIRSELPNPAAADVNCDGKINVIDAMFIAQYIAGIRPSLGCD